MKKLILVLFLICIATNVFAKAGLEMPTPKISATEAITLASNYFYDGKTEVIDGNDFKIEEYILISAEYTNDFNSENQKEWAWKIIFVHPLANDHTITYKITNDKNITEIYISE